MHIFVTKGNDKAKNNGGAIMDTNNLAEDFSKRYGAEPEIFSVGMPVHLVGLPEADGSHLLSCAVSMASAAAVHRIDDLVVELERSGSNLRLSSPVGKFNKADECIFGFLDFIEKKRYKIPGMQLMVKSDIPEGIIHREAETAAVAGAVFTAKGSRIAAEDIAHLCASYTGKKSRPDFGVMLANSSGVICEGRSYETPVFGVGESVSGVVLIMADIGKHSMSRKHINSVSEENRRAQRCLSALQSEGIEGFAKEFTDISCPKADWEKLIESIAKSEIILGVRYREYMQMMVAIAKEERTDAAVSLITARCEQLIGQRPLLYITRLI